MIPMPSSCSWRKTMKSSRIAYFLSPFSCGSPEWHLFLRLLNLLFKNNFFILCGELLNTVFMFWHCYLINVRNRSRNIVKSNCRKGNKFLFKDKVSNLISPPKLIILKECGSFRLKNGLSSAIIKLKTP